MTAILDILSALCLASGSFFCLVGGIGLIRMPDFYTRMHAGSIVDTLGAWLILVGLMFQAGLTLVSVKLGMIGVLLFFASPSASHALARAALLRGLAPKLASPLAGTEETSSRP